MRKLGLWVRTVWGVVVRWWWTARLSLTSPDKLVQAPVVERKAAELGFCPKRCGLCKSFSREAFEQVLLVEPSFARATQHLKPWQMGQTREVKEGPPPLPGSERARELRPNLTQDWQDYGGCTRYGLAVWGFDEAPAVPNADSPPCGAWK